MKMPLVRNKKYENALFCGKDRSKIDHIDLRQSRKYLVALVNRDYRLIASTLNSLLEKSVIIISFHFWN